MRVRTAIAGAAAVAAALAFAVSGGWAFWTSTGDATGAVAVDAGDVQQLTVTAATPARLLLPGRSGSVALRLTNPADKPVRVGALALDTARGRAGFDVDAAHAGCGTGALRFDARRLDRTLAPGETLPVALDDALSLGLDAPNACQGATFTVYLRVVA